MKSQPTPQEAAEVKYGSDESNLDIKLIREEAVKLFGAMQECKKNGGDLEEYIGKEAMGHLEALAGKDPEANRIVPSVTETDDRGMTPATTFSPC